MIQKHQMIPMLLDACPGFKPIWEEHVAYWARKEAGIYNDLSEFVHYVMAAYEQGQTPVLRTASDTLERFLVDGDSDVEEIAVLGIIETLQNAASHQPYTYELFVPLLGPISLREWNTVERGWNDLIERNSKANKADTP